FHARGESGAGGRQEFGAAGRGLRFGASDLLLSQQTLLFPAPVEFDKDRDLPAQNVGLKRFHKVIHSAQLVTLANPVLASIDGRNENDRCIARSRTLANE